MYIPTYIYLPPTTPEGYGSTALAERFPQHTLRKVAFHFLSLWMGCDRGDCFLFDFMDQMDIYLVQNSMENCHHDHISFNMKGNLFFSVHCQLIETDFHDNVTVINFRVIMQTNHIHTWYGIYYLYIYIICIWLYVRIMRSFYFIFYYLCITDTSYEWKLLIYIYISMYNVAINEKWTLWHDNCLF